MKRQGIEGFTFDSKAEEWLHWCESAAENCSFTTHGRIEHMKLWRKHLNDWWDDVATEPRHSPAQPQNTVGIGEGSGRGDNRVLWPLLAVAGIALVCAAGMKGWL